MKLRWRKFERSLKQRVRAVVRATPALRQEYKQQRRGRRWWNFRFSNKFYRLLYWGLAFNFLGRSFLALETLTVFIWLWALGAMFWRTAQLQSTLYFGPELNLFRHLPISDEEIFEAQWQRFLRTSFWPTLDFALLYGVLAYRMGAGWQSPVVGLGLGALQALFNVGFAVVLFGCGWRRWLPMLAMGSYGAALGLLIFGSGMTQLIASLHQAAGWLPPAGWIFYALGVSASGNEWSDLLPNLVAGVGLAAFPLALQRLRRRYVLTEEMFTQAFRLTAAGEAGALRLQEYAGDFAQKTADVVAGVQAGALRQRLDWAKAGMIERWVARCLTERERNLAEFLTAANPGWTKGFRSMLVLSVVALVGVKLFPSLVGAGAGFLFIYTFIAVFGLSSKFGRGFGPAATVGLPPPHYAFLPLSFGELHRCLMKIIGLRYLISSPAIAVVIFGFNHMLNPGSPSIWPMAGKLWLLGMLALPVVAIFPFSTNSNDTDRWWFSIPTLFYILLLVGAGIGFVLVSDWFTRGLLGGSFAVLSFGAGWLYQRSFNHNHFDLLPAKRADTSGQQPPH